MVIHLHKLATTTPKVRAAIQISDDAGTVLAERFGVTPQTIYKWRKRDSIADRSNRPHRLQTTLTPAQEATAVALRRTLLLPLDDLLAVVREFLNPHVSRSGLDRCLRRHDVCNLRNLQAKAAQPKQSDFNADGPGYIHIHVKYLPQTADESAERYLFVAIDHATRWVFIRFFTAKTAANAQRFLHELERACPIPIRTVLTDNGKQLTDRLFERSKRAATGEHEFDTLCAALDIEPYLTPPKPRQTDNKVECFDGPIEEVLQNHHFRSGKELETTPLRHVQLCDQQLPQSILSGRSPLMAMKNLHEPEQALFKEKQYNLPGCETPATEEDFNKIVALLSERLAHFLKREALPGTASRFYSGARFTPCERNNRLMLLRDHLSITCKETFCAIQSAPGVYDVKSITKRLAIVSKALDRKSFKGMHEKSYWKKLKQIIENLSFLSNGLEQSAEELSDAIDPDLALNLCTALEVQELYRNNPEADALLTSLSAQAQIHSCVNEANYILKGHFGWTPDPKGGRYKKQRGAHIAAYLIGMAHGLGLKPTRNESSSHYSACDAVCAVRFDLRNAVKDNALKIFNEIPMGYDGMEHIWRSATTVAAQKRH